MLYSRRSIAYFAALLVLTACGDVDSVGRTPAITPGQRGIEHNAMMTYSLPQRIDTAPPLPTTASLWTGDRGSLLGDWRAVQRGDILTVVIEIDDSAEISNSSDRARSASQDLAIPQLFGLPQWLDPQMPPGASLGAAVQLDSGSAARGNGSISRNERLTLRVAATIIDVLPNGVLAIEGSQEVRVNFELRELLITGFVRPADISRQNEITYDKIASARISYGGRGQISEMQQPRHGQQLAEYLMPF